MAFRTILNNGFKAVVYVFSEDNRFLTCHPLSNPHPLIRHITKHKNMTTQQIADRLVALCRNGQMLEAEQELFADDVVSIEPEHSPAKSAHGKIAVLEKGKAFAASIEARHGGAISDPVVGGKYFSISMQLDATFKDAGRMVMDEICLYEVRDGKIISEQFFF